MLLAKYLARRGYDCWVLDLRGHGHSEAPPTEPTFETFATLDVAAAVGAVCRETGHDRVMWVGHSGGGFLPLMAIARDPAVSRSIAGVVALASQADGAGVGVRARIGIALFWLVTNVVRKFPGRLFRFGPEDEFRRVMNQWFRWNWTKRWRGDDGLDYRGALATVDTPVLALAGAGDRLIAPARGCASLVDGLGSRDKSFEVCGVASGYCEDYSHARIVASRSAHKEIFPKVAAWLDQRSLP